MKSIQLDADDGMMSGAFPISMTGISSISTVVMFMCDSIFPLMGGSLCGRALTRSREEQSLSSSVFMQMSSHRSSL